MQGTRRAAMVVLIAALACAAEVAPAAAAQPATARAGAAARSIAPPLPVFSGGFGLSPPITHMRDPLEVRAFYVASGSPAVAFAVIDAQGHFAAYQEGSGYGATAERADAARAITAAGGPKMTQADVIVQATPSPAAPTLEGIWGPVPPQYLKLVHDQVVAAITAAAREARP